MDLLTIAEAARRVDIGRSRILGLCRTGKLPRARKECPPGHRRARWFVDVAELRAYIAQHCRRRSPGAAPKWSPRVAPAPDGQLTEIQHSTIAGEAWHRLEDIQPAGAPPGAVRVSWSDGESFLVYPNGETGDYHYARR